MAKYTLKVNGRTRTVDVDADTPLLYVLRENLALKGPRFGCGLGQCGACTVHVEGQAVRSCMLPVAELKGAVTTLEGLGTSAKPSKLQQAFIDAQAAQCGYCINGMIMQSKVLLDRKPDPTDQEIRTALASNLCRCGVHNNIIRAVRRAAREMKR